MENMHEYDDKTILLKAYDCDFVSGEVTLNDHDQYAWVEKEQLIQYKFAPADISIVSEYLPKFCCSTASGYFKSALLYEAIPRAHAIWCSNEIAEVQSWSDVNFPIRCVKNR